MGAVDDREREPVVTRTALLNRVKRAPKGAPPPFLPKSQPLSTARLPQTGLSSSEEVGPKANPYRLVPMGLPSGKK